MTILAETFVCVVMIPVANTVVSVTAASVPAEIVQSVVKGIVVPVACNHATGRLPSKRSKNETVNLMKLTPTVAEKSNKQIGPFPLYRFKEPATPRAGWSPTTVTVDVSKIRYFVKSFVSWYGHPAFDHENSLKL